MNHQIFTTLALLTACGGEISETPLIEQPRYNLPVEILDRTVARGSLDGLFASEKYSLGEHACTIFAVKPAETLVFAVAHQADNVPKKDNSVYLLVDLVNTPKLDHPLGDRKHETLYSLLLAEQQDRLDGLKANPLLVDYWLKVMKQD